MDPFERLNGIVVPLDRANIDTDQIVPKQFLKLVGRIGFGQYLFYDWRFDQSGNLNPKFVLNDPRYKEAKILLARSNFGCGSSREHAVWALSDYGFKAVIASSYADIFYNNCFKNGLLPIALNEKIVDSLFREATKPEACSLEISLEEQTIRKGDEIIRFEIDTYRKKCLVEGLDDIALTLEWEHKISAYEQGLSRYRLVHR
ncbi:MAG: 3-isopropylmalate dehydratase small subunit [Candidatus Bathyarchaeia archaeon]|jgi:3-isopropylmalate/(R)-2-methylmalate dehydratase small subunit